MRNRDKRSCLAKTSPSILALLERVSPRPGGYLKLLVPTRSLDFVASGGPIDSTSTVQTNCREYRIEQILNELINEPIDEEQVEIRNKKNKFKHAKLIGVLISTIMILAAGGKAPTANIIASTEYLKCIRDEDEHFPPNVQKLLNHFDYIGTESERSITKLSCLKSDVCQPCLTSTNQRVLTAERIKSSKSYSSEGV